ncbi:proprotein convertase subtilisin/kexin type 9 [Hippocampus zosterae]|uniref:proprotein convertase subtilisin/kexin type 9 n=1 Tax=Hippocampus zosterae TaxID=109293 RepID=UPI00223D71A6|nr:proprotein convertase subtilisin/kexin type 9 [Hippocampus zosterae]
MEATVGWLCFCACWVVSAHGRTLQVSAPVIQGINGTRTEPAAEFLLCNKVAWRVPGRYMVILHGEGDVHRNIRKLRSTAARRGHQVEVLRTFFFFSGALRGFLVKMSSDVIQLALKLPHVQYVEEDSFVFAQSAPWSLNNDLHGGTRENTTYTPPNDGGKMEVYLMDGSIRASHRELKGRVVATDFNEIPEEDGVKVSRCSAHSTHVASVVSGADSGVARGAGIHLVRVLNCHGKGSVSGALAGLEYIRATANGSPVVVLLPFVGAFSRSLNLASRKLVASGAVVVAAAGNYKDDACFYSPASEPEVITVGAVDVSNRRVALGSGGTNFGRCVNLFAPGDDIISASSECDTCFTAHSGTSQAAAHVAGIAALILSSNRKASPLQVLQAMLRYSTSRIIDVRALMGRHRLNTPNAMATVPHTVNNMTSFECRVSEPQLLSSCPPGWTRTPLSPERWGDTVCCRHRRV